MSGPSVYTSPVGITRLHPLQVLAQLVQDEVPALRNVDGSTPTTVGQQDPSRQQTWPSLNVRVPSGAKWNADWSQPTRIDRWTSGPKAGRDKEYEVPGSFSPSPGSVGNIVYRVGFWTGPVVLTVGATVDAQRAALEQAVLNVFAQYRGHLRAQVPRCANAWHSWTLTTGTWQDEMAFDRALFSDLEVEGQHPILVELRGVSRIETLQLQFTQDMITPFDEIASDQIEAFDVQSDGSITRATI